MSDSDAIVFLLGADTGAKHRHPEQWVALTKKIHINQTDGSHIGLRSSYLELV